MIMFTFLIIFSIQIELSFSLQWNNALIGLPSVSCEDDSIRVQIETEQPFNGRFFVKGEHTKKECIRDYTKGLGDDDDTVTVGSLESHKRPNADALFRRKSDDEGLCPPCDCEKRRKRETRSNQLELVVGLDKCNIQRDRIASPPGIRLSFVIVVSFHHSFITKLDKAYRVQCLYSESNRIISTEMDVKMSQSENISRTVTPTSCEYKIINADGRVGTNVRVGDEIRHEWSCQSSYPDVYSLLVHSCTVSDGRGDRMEMIDERGCSTDPSLFSTPSYSSTSLSASLLSSVFKFPDRTSMDIQCSISLCTRIGEECGRITPPHCSLSSKRLPRSTISISTLPTWTLHSSTLSILDSDSDLPPSSSLPQSLSSYLFPSIFCLSIPSYSLLVSLTSSTFVASFALLICAHKPFRLAR
ncbi:hypothetical protein PENTCL1PPCAC_6564 [Pristionchus entomophagus]|uniref:ZP domain-containing protein n=1 Tax=Pristionchus entomophagus TaxID=358040 RepID=A0AAV5SSP7_9BILA|nr:hypothetical protein PENTCL1PPCAC_6564 [Pristionchus entomophagus]